MYDSKLLSGRDKADMCTDRQTRYPVLLSPWVQWTPISRSVHSHNITNTTFLTYLHTSVKLSIGSRSFSVSGPTVWNALPDYLRNPTLSIDVFKRYLKTVLFAQY